MKISITALMFFFNYHLIAQSLDTVNLFKVYKHEREVIFMCHSDTNQIVLRNQFNSTKSAIGENSIILFRDTTLLHAFNNEVYIKDIVIYDKPLVLLITNPSLEGREQVYTLLDLNSGKLTNLSLNEYLLTYYDGHLIGGQPNIAKYDGYGDYVTELKKIPLNTYKHSLLTEFENDPEEALGVVEIFPFSSTRSLKVKVAYCYTRFSGCEKSKTFNIDMKTSNVLEDKIDLFQTESTKSFIELSTDYHLVESKGHFFLYSAGGSTHNVLDRTFKVVGWNYSNNILHSYNVESKLDEKKYKTGKTLNEVIIPYKLTYELETSIYDIYHDRQINKLLLEQFGLYELLILKNMIFAKHNYAFSKPFYQAYFNLFEFYNDEKMRASRTKDMSGLLTGTDTENLEVINTALKKYN